MVGQPQRCPTTYRNKKILQEQFKGFLVNGAETVLATVKTVHRSTRAEYTPKEGNAEVTLSSSKW